MLFVVVDVILLTFPYYIEHFHFFFMFSSLKKAKIKSILTNAKNNSKTCSKQKIEQHTVIEE